MGHLIQPIFQLILTHFYFSLRKQLQDWKEIYRKQQLMKVTLTIYKITEAQSFHVAK